MRAILLAAGLGTRLQPLTLSRPKCLMPIKGTPLLGLWLIKLIEAGIDSIIVNTHYLSQQVEEFVAQTDCKKYVQCVYEPILLGTAGTLIKNVESSEEQDILLIHADNYFDGSLLPLIAAHRNRPTTTMMTMLTFQTDEPHLCGIVEVDVNNIMCAFHEKISNPPGNLANGALYLISKELIRIIKSEFASAQDFSTEIIPHLIGKVFCFTTSNTYLDIGTIKNYVKVK